MAAYHQRGFFPFAGALSARFDLHHRISAGTTKTTQLSRRSTLGPIITGSLPPYLVDVKTKDTPESVCSIVLSVLTIKSLRKGEGRILPSGAPAPTMSSPSKTTLLSTPTTIRTFGCGIDAGNKQCDRTPSRLIRQCFLRWPKGRRRVILARIARPTSFCRDGLRTASATPHVNKSSTGIVQPGTAGSASALSPRR